MHECYSACILLSHLQYQRVTMLLSALTLNLLLLLLFFEGEIHTYTNLLLEYHI